jgi:hypothetical protein
MEMSFRLAQWSRVRQCTTPNRRNGSSDSRSGPMAMLETAKEPSAFDMPLLLQALCHEVGKLRQEVSDLRAGHTSHKSAPSRDAFQPVRVTPKDVRLELFWGAADQTAHTIDHKYFLPLLNWLKSCQTQLRASQLPPELWVATTLGALRGAARASFTRIDGNAPLNNWTFEKFQLALTSLVPNHAAQFSRAALALKFSVKSLCDDIAQFALTIRHRELAPDSQFIFGQLQDKMLEAWPEIFLVSTSRFNLQLDYASDFERQIEMAQKIASRLQCEGILDGLREKKNRPRVEDAGGASPGFAKNHGWSVATHTSPSAQRMGKLRNLRNWLGNFSAVMDVVIMWPQKTWMHIAKSVEKTPKLLSAEWGI